MSNITILGCCRQSSLFNHFYVNDILEKINYCHYSKEVLQLIKFLKYRDIEPEYTKYLFRSYILAGYGAVIDENMHHFFNNQFINSDFIVIEIASRVSYKWKQNDKVYYTHEIAHEDKYGFYDKENIEVYNQSDEEIEEDLIQIKKELEGKKFMIISHFCTYERGKRWDLVCLLERLCFKHNIHFFNQTYMIYKYGKEILLEESKYSHYNDVGHYLVGQILKSRIDKINTSFNELYNIYYTNPFFEEIDGIYGYGDYNRGCIYLQQANEKYANDGFDIKLSFSHHILNNFLFCQDYTDINVCNNRKCIKLYEENINDFDYKYIFTNKNYRDIIISQKTKDLIKDKCFTPRFNIKEKLNLFKSNNNITDGNYNIIHIRLYDSNIELNNSKYNIIIDNINKIIVPNEKYLLLCSINNYFDNIEIPGVIKTGLLGGHLGKYNCTYKEAEDTVIELMLMTTSKYIYQMSVYIWGSGFSDMVNRIFDIPIQNIPI